MKLASLRNGRPDGQLAVVSADLTRWASAGRIAPSLMAALDSWHDVLPQLQALSDSLNEGSITGQPFEPGQALAPLPRSFQFIDGAGYLSHLERVRSAAGSKDAQLQEARPLLYQGASDQFAGPREPMVVPEADLGLDFEGEIAAIVGPVPMRASKAEALAAIRLFTLLNDTSLRRLVVEDLNEGFGFFHAKPASTLGPVAVTPDELGADWRDGRVHLRLRVELNGKLFGQPDAGTDMHFDFGDLIVAATRTRALGSGTLIGGGTVSNRHDEGLPTRPGGIGFACLVEARTVEKLKYGRARTPFLKEGDTLRIAALDAEGRPVLGAIEQGVEVKRR